MTILLKDLQSIFVLSMALSVLFVVPVPSEETTIKGQTMEMANKGETVMFRGEVVLTRGTDVIRADTMSTNRGRDKATATGRVRFRRIVSSTETWSGSGQSAFYDTQTGEAYIEGGKKQAHLICEQVLSSTATRQIDIFAERFDFNRETSRAVAQGQVYAKSRETGADELSEFWADRADYNGAEKKIVLTGRKKPLLKQKSHRDEKTVQGDVITFYVDTKRLISEGGAEAVMVDKAGRAQK